MDYARIVREAWHMAWRHPSLWIIALFAGGANASFSLSGGGNGGGANADSIQSALREARAPISDAGVDMRQVTRWLTENMGIIIVVFALVAAVILVFVVISIIAQGGIVTATVEIAQGRRGGFGQAISGGFRYFWRFTGLSMLVFILTMIIALPLLGLVAYGLWQALTRQDFSFINGGTIGLGLLLVVVGIIVGIVASVVVPFAQRAMVVENMAPSAALGAGWGLFRARLGTSLILWIVNLAVSIGIGIGLAIVILFGLIVLAVPAFILWSMYQFNAPTILYLVIAGGLAMLTLLIMAAFSNTFFWSYWTLAYLGLTHESPPAPISPVPAPPAPAVEPPLN